MEGGLKVKLQDRGTTVNVRRKYKFVSSKCRENGEEMISA